MLDLVNWIQNNRLKNTNKAITSFQMFWKYQEWSETVRLSLKADTAMVIRQMTKKTQQRMVDKTLSINLKIKQDEPQQ
jgi:hypothetical protein